MKSVHLLKPLLFSCAIFILLFANCGLLDFDNRPTKSRMEGVWQVTEAYDEDGNDIMDQISFPITAFHLSSDNTVISTAGPMTMYLVYGASNSKFLNVVGKVDQVFNYASLNFNGGEWFIDGGTVNRFTLEMKLEVPGQTTLTELLDLLGVGVNYQIPTIYHKFRDVKVTFDWWSDSVMTWEFDNTTTAVYNMKDKYGDYVAWNGWSAYNFSRCTFVLTKRSAELKDLVELATQD